MGLWSRLKKLAEPRTIEEISADVRSGKTPSFKELERLYEYQKVHGVDMSRYANAEGRVEALVCGCGRFRRDFPPETYVCVCGLTKFDPKQKKVLMCRECSKKIIEGRSSFATYAACPACRNEPVVIREQAG